jgi:GTP pyrophosphokinase
VTVALHAVDEEFAQVLNEHGDRLDLELVERAFQSSEAAHRGQKRLSGDDFISHSIAVAKILVRQQMDSVTVAAALLHDVAEDSEVTLKDIREDFGDEVADIVDGLTKISTLTFRSAAEEQSENYRKLLLSIARDARVIIVKLADRLHNMRTLEHLPAEKQRAIAQETREIYAPLAHRFGMAGIRSELEDLSFKFLESDDYRALVEQIQAKREERQEVIERLRVPLEEALRSAGIEDYEIAGRPKHLWSIYKKMLQRHRPFEEIYDLMAGAHQGLHRLSQVERVPVAAHDHLRAGRAALRDPDPHARDALDRGLRHRRPLGLQGEQEARRAGRTLRVVPPAARAAAGCPHAGGVPRVPQDRSLRGRDLRVHAAR